MPKRIVPLTSLQITNAKPKEKEYKISDGGGFREKLINGNAIL